MIFDLVLNDQRRAFSDQYVNFHLFEASFFLVIHEKHPMSSNPFFEPQMLNEITIILIASKEQRETEQDSADEVWNTDDKTILPVLEGGK